MEMETKDEDKQIWLSFGYKHFSAQIPDSKENRQYKNLALLDQKTTTRVLYRGDTHLFVNSCLSIIFVGGFYFYLPSLLFFSLLPFNHPI